MSVQEPEPPRVFPTTHWSQIYLATNRQREEGAKALGAIVETYREPLLKHLKFKFRTDDHQASEWLDAFVEKRVLENDLLKRASKQNGLFRGFLVRSLDHFVVDQIRHANRKVRKPEGGLQTLDGLEEYQGNGSPQQTDPGDRAWALSVLELARTQTEQFYQRKGKPEMWDVFLHGCFLPLRDGAARPSDTELASRFGFESATQASNAITTVKRKFGNALRDVVAKYVPRAAPAEVDEEIRELMAILANE